MSWTMHSPGNGYPYVILGVGSVSIIFSLIVICIYIFNRNLRTFSTRMIVCISISDIIFTLGLICNDTFMDLSIRATCNLSAFITVFGSLSSLAWGCIISYTVYINSLSPGDKSIIHKSKQLVKSKSILYAYIAPFFCAVIPLFFEDYQNVGDVCYITIQSTSGFVTSIIIGLLPILCEICFIFYYVFKSIKAQRKEHSYSSKWLLTYPMIGVIAFGSFFIQKSYELITGLTCGCDYDWHSISFILCALNGLLNAVCYGLNSTICLPISGWFRSNNNKKTNRLHGFNHNNIETSHSWFTSSSNTLTTAHEQPFRESDKYTCILPDQSLDIFSQTD